MRRASPGEYPLFAFGGKRLFAVFSLVRRNLFAQPSVKSFFYRYEHKPT